MPANYANGKIGYDLTFEMNSFGEPRIRSEIETLKDVVLFILMTKPGQYPSLPQIGMNIEKLLYSFYDELDENELQSTLVQQCNMLGMYFQNGAIAFKTAKSHGQPDLLLQIQGAEMYPIGYKKDTNNTNKTYLIGITLDDLNQMIFNVNTKLT